jgi:hypothetical protein
MKDLAVLFYACLAELRLRYHAMLRLTELNNAWLSLPKRDVTIHSGHIQNQTQRAVL